LGLASRADAAYVRRVLQVCFASGTLEVRGLDAEVPVPSFLVPDPRSNCLRAPALHYAQTVLWLRQNKLAYSDEARSYVELPAGARVTRQPRPYQQAALQAWCEHQGRGVVVLPTGAGKTQVAVMAIDHWRRATLVVVPTLDLVRQWYDQLRTAFGAEVGVVGGGEYKLAPLTVTTYDSAYLHMEHFGNRFGIVVFDECHHLPSESYAFAARQCLAPFRLGLTATPERADGKQVWLDELIGPIVYRQSIVELSGSYLSEYEVHTLNVHLTPEEREEHDRERAIYTGFLRAQGIRMGSPSGWSDFIMRSASSREGMRAMAAYRRQKELSLAAPAKFELLFELLVTHAEDRMLIFTQDNATAHMISRRFLIPAITHHTKVTERSEILARLASGEYNAVVTSKVLNEGVDVPEANVAVVISGSGSVLEHVQRLGRILRPQSGKLARLYEVISAGTAETGTHERRREHDAYR
jgi:superfamily II DNA or RNA helicase